MMIGIVNALTAPKVRAIPRTLKYAGASRDEKSRPSNQHSEYVSSEYVYEIIWEGKQELVPNS